MLDQISGSRDDLLEAIQNLTLRAPLQTLVNEALAATQDISTGILLLQARLDYVNVHPGGWEGRRARRYLSRDWVGTGGPRGRNA